MKEIKWHHIMDCQPEDGDSIIQCDPPYDGHYTMGMREYKLFGTWQDFIKGCEDFGWPKPNFYWCYAKDFPFPDKQKGEKC